MAKSASSHSTDQLHSIDSSPGNTSFMSRFSSFSSFPNDHFVSFFWILLRSMTSKYKRALRISAHSYFPFGLESHPRWASTMALNVIRHLYANDSHICSSITDLLSELQTLLSSHLFNISPWLRYASQTCPKLNSDPHLQTAPPTVFLVSTLCKLFRSQTLEVFWLFLSLF